VLIVRAVDVETATQRAQRIARSNLPPIHRNEHDQTVRRRLPPAWSAYDLFHPPREGREVFSDTRRFSKRVSDGGVAAALLPSSLTPRERERRRQFWDGDLARAFDAYVTARVKRRGVRR
jgi:hypothetical protein